MTDAGKAATSPRRPAPADPGNAPAGGAQEPPREPHPLAGAPFLRRLGAYLGERFPLAGHGLLIVSYYSSNQFLARTLENPGRPMHYDVTSVLGALTLFLFFFHLRVFDEHKDFDADARHHPERLLQRGVITLGELRRLGVGAIAVQAVAAALASPAALAAWAAAFAFSLLMRVEFFAGDWLRRRFLLYAGSHLLVMPLLALMVYSFATGRWPWQAPGWFLVYAWVGFFVTLNWEISRKIRAPEDEIAGLDTYSRIFGTYGAAYAVLGVRVVDTGLVALVGLHLGLSAWFYAALVLLFLVCAWGVVDYRLHTGRRTARRLETYAGLYVVAFDLILALEIVHQVGLEL